jgi:hypothetical protein
MHSLERMEFSGNELMVGWIPCGEAFDAMHSTVVHHAANNPKVSASEVLRAKAPPFRVLLQGTQLVFNFFFREIAFLDALDLSLLVALQGQSRPVLVFLPFCYINNACSNCTLSQIPSFSSFPSI